MLENGHIRCAGVLAGVSLERHLLTMCETSEKEIEYNHSFNIGGFVDALHKENILGDSKKGQIEWLASIRKKCAHDDKEDPDRTEVNQLIEQSKEIIRKY